MLCERPVTSCVELINKCIYNSIRVAILYTFLDSQKLHKPNQPNNNETKNKHKQTREKISCRDCMLTKLFFHSLLSVTLKSKHRRTANMYVYHNNNKLTNDKTTET